MSTIAKGPASGLTGWNTAAATIDSVPYADKRLILNAAHVAGYQGAPALTFYMRLMAYLAGHRDWPTPPGKLTEAELSHIEARARHDADLLGLDRVNRTA